MPRTAAVSHDTSFRSATASWVTITVVIIAGILAGVVAHGVWLYVAGLVALCLMLLWPVPMTFGLLALLIPFDNVSAIGQEPTGAALTRYIAACLLPGYVWLVIAGGLWLIAGLPPNNLTIDAMLHAIFLGFVISMIFGHAPIILPAVLPVDITYRSVFYAPLVLLHGALVVRVIADLTLNPALRQWAGLFNVLAILLFLATMLLSAKRHPRAVVGAA